MVKLLVAFALLMKACTLMAQAEDSAWFVNHYTKTEQMIPMRDGVKLFTSIYAPKDSSVKHPILLQRTPYSCSPYGPAFLAVWKSYMTAYLKENYILVFQDVRGRYMSEGDFEDVRPFIAHKKTARDVDEASDSYDAIDWLVHHIAGNNNRVGVIGTSYPGFYATEAALSGHPALKAVSPQAPVTDWFMGDDFHHKGVFFPMDAFSFYPSFGKPHRAPMMDYGEGLSSPVKDNYKFFLQTGALRNLDALVGDSIRFWHEMFRHPNYDAWWQARNARVGLYNVRPAMLWVGGLFDAEDCYGAWNAYKACEKQSPQTNSRIVMGPWYHGQWSREGSQLGHLRFGSNTSAHYRETIEIPFFKYWLEETGNIGQLAEATIFFTGENEWKQFAKWPPPQVQYKPLYAGANNELAFTRPAAAAKRGPLASFYEYTSDPFHPVPYTEDVHEERTREYMTDDQRFASRRPDVLSLQTGLLNEDLVLAGPVVAELQTSINTTDADFVVKLIDVFPDNFAYDSTMNGNGDEYPMGGYQALVRGEIMRGKFRNSFEKPEPFTPGKVTLVKFELPDVAHTFKKGHRLMIQVQSTWFPLADRNPQKFTDIYHASDSAFQPATIRIYRDAKHATRFILPVLEQQ